MKKLIILLFLFLLGTHVVFAQTPSATTSTVAVSPPVIQTSGTSTITVQLKDANGNNLISGGAAVSFVNPISGLQAQGLLVR